MGKLKKRTKLIAIATFCIVVALIIANKDNIGWNLVRIGEAYSTSETIELDLDGDNIKEKINIKDSGKYITINDKDYIINKYLKDTDTAKEYDSPKSKGILLSKVTKPQNTSLMSVDVGHDITNYETNQYWIVDLNSDGVLEIIHETFLDGISPIVDKYTIYNFKNDNLTEVGKFSIGGKIQNYLRVKGNTVKIEYHPDETKDYYREVIFLELTT